MSNLQPICCLKFDFQKMDQHVGGKCHNVVRCNNFATVPIHPKTLGYSWHSCLFGCGWAGSRQFYSYLSGVHRWQWGNSLRRRHNGRLKSPASWLFTQPFIQGADQRKHQSSASLDLVRRVHRWPVNSPHKWPVKRKMSPIDDVIMVIIW